MVCTIYISHGLQPYVPSVSNEAEFMGFSIAQTFWKKAILQRCITLKIKIGSSRLLASVYLKGTNSMTIPGLAQV